MIDAGTKVGKAFYDQLGISEISGVGMSSFEFDKGLHRNKAVIHHFPDKSTGKLWSLFGSEPHEIGMLKMLPADTALALSHEFNAKALMEWLPELAKASGDRVHDVAWPTPRQSCFSPQTARPAWSCCHRRRVCRRNRSEPPMPQPRLSSVSCFLFS